MMPGIYDVYAHVYDNLPSKTRWMANDYVPTLPTQVALLGECPSKDECDGGLPFIGPAGVFLEAALVFANLPRHRCFITNVFPFEAPRDYQWKVGEVDHVAPYIREKLKRFKYVVCLGKQAHRVYSDAQDSIIDCSGRPFQFQDQVIIPSIHPSYALKAYVDPAGGDEGVFWYLVLALKTLKALLNNADPFPSSKQHKAHLIVERSMFRELLHSFPQDTVTPIDLEATDTNPYLTQLPLCASMCFDNTNTYTMAFKPWYPMSDFSFIDFLREVEDASHLDFIMHNLPYDYSVMRRFGYKGKAPIVDTMFLTHLGFEFMPKGLKFLSSFFCQIEPYSFPFGKIQPFIKGAPYKDYEYWLMHLLRYCGVDSLSTRLLFKALPTFVGVEWARIKELYDSYIHPLLLTLNNLQRNGMILNQDILNTVRKTLNETLRNNESNFKKYCPEVDNLKSPDQISAAFRRLLTDDPDLFKIKKTKKGGLSITKDVLKSLADKGVQPAGLLLDYRKVSKILTTYVDSYPSYLDSDGLIHSQFGLTKTSRLRSSDPALQTLPRKSIVLSLFTADFGLPPYDYVLIKADFSAAEARLLAAYARIFMMLNPKIDVHVLSATIFFGVTVAEVTPEMRQYTKNLTFGTIYGASPNRIALLVYGVITDETVAKAKDLLNTFFTRFPEIKQFMKDREFDIATKGYIQTPLGLRRHFPIECLVYKLTDPHNGNIFGALGRRLGWNLYSKAQREGYNMWPQSGVAALTNKSMISLESSFDTFDWQSNSIPPQLNLQVHDALIVRSHYTSFVDTLKLMQQNMIFPHVVKDVYIPVDFAIGWDMREQREIIPAAESVDAINYDNIIARLLKEKIDDKTGEIKEPARHDLSQFVEKALQFHAARR